MGKTDCLSSKTKYKARLSIFTIFIQLCIASSQHNKARKNIRGSQTGQEVKLSLFSDNIIIHIENSMESTKKLQN